MHEVLVNRLFKLAKEKVWLGEQISLSEVFMRKKSKTVIFSYSFNGLNIHVCFGYIGNRWETCTGELK